MALRLSRLPAPAAALFRAFFAGRGTSSHLGLSPRWVSVRGLAPALEPAHEIRRETPPA